MCQSSNPSNLVSIVEPSKNHSNITMCHLFLPFINSIKFYKF